jgi:hypothetical protein
MIRCFMRSVFASSAAVAALCASAAAQTPAAPQSSAAQPKPPAPACIYSSRTYGDGALVCVEKSLMLKCAADGATAAWSVVADKDLGGKCQAPARGTIYQQRARWNRQNIRREITPPG